jgi:hypothetical protein
LRVVKRDDAKTELDLVISSGDPDNHMYFLHVLFHMHQLRDVLCLSDWSTYLETTALLQFFAFPNVDEDYAGVIDNIMSRPQFPVIDIL